MSHWNSVNKIGLHFVAPDKFLIANGFTHCVHYSNEKSIEKILNSGTFASCGFSSEQEEIPYIDHAILYKNPQTKLCCLVYIPYKNADDIEDEIFHWANNKGLKANIYENSWYNEATCLVIVSLPSVTIALE